MLKNQFTSSKKNDLKHLSELYLAKSAPTVISGWFGEMDGETTEEDWRIYPYHLRLDGKISSPSFKKVLKNLPDAIHHKW
ncbi:hypothetical protein GCM10025861_24720 [Methanobacterium petrolearium]|nr:hypothetical protein GCM10025861_24720 [Methanobacterium petrolearium]